MHCEYTPDRTIQIFGKLGDADGRLETDGPMAFVYSWCFKKMIGFNNIPQKKTKKAMNIEQKILQQEEEDDQRFLKWETAVVEKYGKQWFEKQRALQMKNIDAVAQAAEQRWGHGKPIYYVVMDNLYNYYGEQLADRIAKGCPLSVVTPQEVDHILSDLANRKVKDAEVFCFANGFFPP